ncbi:hypothetical protein MASSI9I_20587 [Massilia sp. 9I]|nr:hypothetical protein MASSI9I_20587 [Massilia sp. 9I]
MPKRPERGVFHILICAFRRTKFCVEEKQQISSFFYESLRKAFSLLQVPARLSLCMHQMHMDCIEQ